MSEGNSKTLIIISVLLLSIGIPSAIQMIFFLSFPGFYEKGFLTGIGQLFICGITIVGNAIIIPYRGLFFFNRYVHQFGIETGKSKLIRKVALLLLISAVLQILLTITVENPFKDPPVPQFF
ncbi:hypothetical protein BCM02_102110 [Paenibacillus methanolicus]|uniref:Uncharacterized protein n=1 Tax=Paenibacillus methanolicus TaxID=582686 RepID=A0A5S5CGT7_9BACL|nr:hypothetical protein BCM02_102110 [Paenibacillus methanolicus]